MGHRRFALLGLAVAVLFAVDGAGAASKGVPRAGGQRRTSKTAGSRPSRSQREAQDDQDFQNWNGEARKGERRSSSRSSRGARSSGSGSSRVRPSSHGSSRSRSRFVFARDAWQHQIVQRHIAACHPAAHPSSSDQRVKLGGGLLWALLRWWVHKLVKIGAHESCDI